MHRFLSLLFSVAASLTLLTATGASAAPANGFYAAKPAAVAAGKMIIRDTVWNCGDAGCASTMRSDSRPALVCASLVKKIGAVESFRAGDTEFGAEDLAKCNAKATNGAAALARN